MFTLHIGPWNQVYLHRYSWGDLRHRSRSSESCRSVPAWRTEALMWVCYSTGSDSGECRKCVWISRSISCSLSATHLCSVHFETAWTDEQHKWVSCINPSDSTRNTWLSAQDFATSTSDISRTLTIEHSWHEGNTFLSYLLNAWKVVLWCPLFGPPPCVFHERWDMISPEKPSVVQLFPQFRRPNI